MGRWGDGEVGRWGVWGVSCKSPSLRLCAYPAGSRSASMRETKKV
ncbi:hypothetical protein [Fortiea contorta]|nr:hypothetical protein [Fortiea contorta]